MCTDKVITLAELWVRIVDTASWNSAAQAAPSTDSQKKTRTTWGEKRAEIKKGGGDVWGGQKHSQHEVLLPARLTAAHSDGCALNILHLQGHVCVKFLCKTGYTKKKKKTLVMLLRAFIWNSLILWVDVWMMSTGHRARLTLGSIKLGFLHCKDIEKMSRKSM